MITVANTPNANALKFIVDRRWMNFVWECRNEKDAAKSQLANHLFAINGVVYMLFGYDFVSVTKSPEHEWSELEAEIIETIDTFLKRNVGLFEDEKPVAETKQEAKEFSEIETKIITVLQEKVQPAIESHGGLVKFISFQDGVVKLDLQGACKGCPSSAYTLKNGIENLLKYYFPEVREVVGAE